MCVHKRFSRVIGYVLLSIAVALWGSPQAKADTAQYSYDELGRLTQVVNGTSITSYSYDEVGNILSVVNGSLTDIPSVTSTSPGTLLVGTKTPVVFTGQSLSSISGITSLNGNIQVNSIAVSATQITAMLTALNSTGDTLKLSFRDTNQTTYQTGIAAVAANVVMSPPLVAALPNSSASTTFSLNPPLGIPITIGLKTDNILIATVPGTVTIPANGSVPVLITTVAAGAANITGLDGTMYGAVVSETPTGANGATSMPISVVIQPTPTPDSTTLNTSIPITVQITPSPSTGAVGTNASLPVSVTITPSPSTPAPSVSASWPISVQIAPSAGTVGPSTDVSSPISVIIAQ